MKAHHAWAGLISIIITYEILCKNGELLSEGMYKAIDKHPILARIPTIITALHLLRALPQSIDPLHNLGKLKVRNIRIR